MLALLIIGALAATPLPTAIDTTVSVSRAAFHDAMRQLWEDHITWTRLYIVSAAAGLPDAEQTAGRLLKNQADIGNAVAPFYGVAAGQRLTALLRGHILTAAKLLGAAAALWEAMGVVPERDVKMQYEAALTAVNERLAEEAFEEARAEGKALTYEQAVGYALEAGSR